MRSDTAQILLIIAGVIVTALFGAFLYREIFPEYKIYQNDYIALEEFRSTYTKQSMPPFKIGIKQIVIEREDKGPAIVDRCTSCHVALQIPYFSPTKIAHDLNGKIVRNAKGHPVQIPNEDYIWLKLDEKIAELRDEKVLEHLKEQGQSSEVKERLSLAAKYESLKTARVGEHVYDVTKVLSMHPLMGNETRPFEFHPIEEYGCVSCHNGNGRGLVTDKAHGPVFDGEYDVEYRGPTPHFTETDRENDPRFAQVFNDKPGHELLFQTSPIFVGALIQAKCMQCHQTANVQLNDAATSASELASRRKAQLQVLTDAYENEKQSVLDLLNLQQMVQEKGYSATQKQLQTWATDYTLPAIKLEQLASQLHYLEKAAQGQGSEEAIQAKVLSKLNRDLTALIGSDTLVQTLEGVYKAQGQAGLAPFLKEHQQDPQASGTVFVKGEALDFNQDLMRHAEEAEKSFSAATSDKQTMSALTYDIDELTQNYERGKELYLSQACYACHRISGFSRGGVGPELTRIGDSYPWYIKESIVWPQADLPTSTMPNMRLDHRELEDLMTFLLAQKGGNRAVADTAYKAGLQAWEAGRKMPWEKPIAPAQMYDLNYSMTVFATQGCASCHRLQGFESNVGFAIEKEKPTFEQLYEEQNWFRKLFPEVVHYSNYDEEMPGSEIVTKIEEHAKEIDKRIVSDVRKNSLLEKIDKEHPEAIEALYSPFRYASRAKNHFYEALIQKESDPQKIAALKEEHQAWKDRVHRVLMMHIQTYGLGRLIGPHLNWSGIYRPDEWLMEHFRNPAGHVPRSIMPVLPFDDTKFYALTYMLDQLAVKNRNAVRQVWDHRGFDPKEAFNMLCAQCHGIELYGNGAIAEWIYPIPKNLHNPDFLRNLTKDKAIYSITHGVKGTPMPPWGEIAENKPAAVEKISHRGPVLTDPEIHYLVDWLYSFLPGSEVIRRGTDVPKWQYTPEDVLEELKREGGKLNPFPSKSKQENKNLSAASAALFPRIGNNYYAALKPVVYSKQEEKEDIENIFDVVPHPTDTGQNGYYIKKEYYTPHNIAEGQKFFLLNCAACHGAEGDGSGIRGSAMQDAKPRMLTNLDWIRSHDDLRLLRSIKFGVPGTSMTPWGDFTSSLQRLQLVIFIRTLSAERDRRENLEQTLYQSFEIAQQKIEGARVDHSKQLGELQKEEITLKSQEEGLERQISAGQGSVEEASAIYQASLNLAKKITKLQEQDQQYLDLKSSVKQERDLFFNLGVSLISKDVSDEVLNDYLEMIRLSGNRYGLKDHQLMYQADKAGEEKVRVIRQKIIDSLDQQIADLGKQREILEGKIATAQRREELYTNQVESDSLKSLKARLITDTEETIRLSQKQEEMVKKLS